MKPVAMKKSSHKPQPQPQLLFLKVLAFSIIPTVYWFGRMFTFSTILFTRKCVWVACNFSARVKKRSELCGMSEGMSVML